jgi:glycosyltransferase 2 family protein
MRAIRAISLIAGLAIVAFLMLRVGADTTLTAAAGALGWRFVLICVPYGLVMAIDTLGWRYAFTSNRASFPRLLAARTAGEAVNVLTAVAPIGGDAVKVWLLRPQVSYRESVASVIVAKTTIIVAQVAFLAIGVVLAVAMSVDARFVRALSWLLVVESLAVGGFAYVQIAGLMGAAGRLLARAGLGHLVGSTEQLDRDLRHFYRREWRRLSLSIGFHLLGWFAGVIEAVLILAALRVPASVPVATMIETLGPAVRFATFFVPGSVGALEGANTAAFTALGLGASAGLAFSLVRRGRQIVWIAIGLLVLGATRMADRAGYARASRPAG